MCKLDVWDQHTLFLTNTGWMWGIFSSEKMERQNKEHRKEFLPLFPLCGEHIQTSYNFFVDQESLCNLVIELKSLIIHCYWIKKKKSKHTLFLEEKDLYFSKYKYIYSRSSNLEVPEENLFLLLHLLTMSLKMRRRICSSFNVHTGDFHDWQ